MTKEMPTHYGQNYTYLSLKIINWCSINFTEWMKEYDTLLNGPKEVIISRIKRKWYDDEINWCALLIMKSTEKRG